MLIHVTNIHTVQIEDNDLFMEYSVYMDILKCHSSISTMKPVCKTQSRLVPVSNWGCRQFYLQSAIQSASVDVPYPWDMCKCMQHS